MSDGADPRELLKRYSGNPILRPHDFPEMVNAVFNPGATIIDGRTLLLMRVEHRTGLSSLVAATSEDGLTGWEIDPVRGLQPRSDGFEEHWGIEDPRITRVGDEYFVVYVGYSTAGPLVCLAKTRDFVQWERSGVLQPPEDKDAALFPTTFGGRWALIHRPAPAMSGLGAHVWISFSPDLRHWGDARVLLAAPLIRGRKGHHQPIADWIARQGYELMRADGGIVRVDQFRKLDRYKEHDIEEIGRASCRERGQI